jgi:uncharacterized protein (TIGR02118 family)
MATTASLLVLWRRPDDSAAFERLYREVHVPLAPRVARLAPLHLQRGTDPYHRVAEFDFDNPVTLQAAFRSSQGHATASHVASLPDHASVKSRIFRTQGSHQIVCEPRSRTPGSSSRKTVSWPRWIRVSTRV